MGLEKKKKGWYLEIKHNDKDEDYGTTRKILMQFTKDTEKVTSKALKLAVQEGVFHNLINPKNIIVHINYYKNNIIIGRYEMVFYDENAAGKELIGHFKGWEYYTVDKNGNTTPYEYSYSPLKVFSVPIIFSIILSLIAIFYIFKIPLDATNKIIFAFLPFYLMLCYSAILLLKKDIAKNHFIKGRYKLLLIATLIFETPYWLATFISIYKISTINDQLNSSILCNLSIGSFIFLILKLAVSIMLEIDKMKN